MAKRLTHNVITGSDPRLGLYFYYSDHFDMNIIRTTSSLTGERTKKEAAFKGFRQSSNRLKEASPIAASLYKLVPANIKQYSLYRTLTGEAIKMLKVGVEATLITETLKKKYIDPLLDAPKRNSEERTVDEPLVSERIKGVADFTSFPQTPSGVKKITRRRRSLLLQQITQNQFPAEHAPVGSDPLLPTGTNVTASPSAKPDSPQEPNQRTKTTSRLTYLGFLPECKKLKIWLRPVGSSGSGSII